MAPIDTVDFPDRTGRPTQGTTTRRDMFLRFDKLQVEMPAPGGDLAKLDGAGDAFTPEYRPEEIFEMAQTLYRQAR
jgi:hypothetical protein